MSLDRGGNCLASVPLSATLHQSLSSWPVQRCSTTLLGLFEPAPAELIRYRFASDSPCVRQAWSCLYIELECHRPVAVAVAVSECLPRGRPCDGNGYKARNLVNLHNWPIASTACTTATTNPHTAVTSQLSRSHNGQFSSSSKARNADDILLRCTRLVIGADCFRNALYSRRKFAAVLSRNRSRGHSYCSWKTIFECEEAKNSTTRKYPDCERHSKHIYVHKIIFNKFLTK